MCYQARSKPSFTCTPCLRTRSYFLSTPFSPCTPCLCTRSYSLSTPFSPCTPCLRTRSYFLSTSFSTLHTLLVHTQLFLEHPLLHLPHCRHRSPATVHSGVAAWHPRPCHLALRGGVTVSLMYMKSCPVGLLRYCDGSNCEVPK